MVKVRESRERERRDICSSMATHEKTEARGRLERWEGRGGREGVTVVPDGGKGAGQVLWDRFKSR